MSKMAGSGDAYLIGGVDYPESMGQEKQVYRNIENEPLIDKIKALEDKLEALTGNLSEDEAAAEMEKEIETGKPVPIERRRQNANDIGEVREILNELLKDFEELLKTPYGALGYLVKSNSEDILKLYGVDTDREFWTLRGGSAIRLPNAKVRFAVDKLTLAGGRRWGPLRGLLVSNPQELPENAKTTDEAIKEIIESIKNKLKGAEI